MKVAVVAVAAVVAVRLLLVSLFRTPAMKIHSEMGQDEKNVTNPGKRLIEISMPFKGIPLTSHDRHTAGEDVILRPVSGTKKISHPGSDGSDGSDVFIFKPPYRYDSMDITDT